MIVKNKKMAVYKEDKRGNLLKEEGTPLNNGAPGRIRTCDTQIRNLVLYPTELRARRINSYL